MEMLSNCIKYTHTIVILENSVLVSTVYLLNIRPSKVSSPGNLCREVF